MPENPHAPFDGGALVRSVPRPTPYTKMQSMRWLRIASGVAEAAQLRSLARFKAINELSKLGI